MQQGARPCAGLAVDLDLVWPRTGMGLPTLSDAVRRDTRWVRSVRRGFLCPLGTLQCPHGGPGAQLCPAHQPARTCDTAGAATGCGWTRADVSPKAGVPSLSQDCWGGFLRAQGSGQARRGRCVASRCRSTSPVAAAPAACGMPSAPRAHEPAQLSKVPPFGVGAFRCCVPSWWSSLPSPPLLPGKGGAEGECLTDSVFKATVVAACDSLVGEAAGRSREGIQTSLQLLDTVLLL